MPAEPFLTTAWLLGPLAGDPPMLDALLQLLASRRAGRDRSGSNRRLDRSTPIAEFDAPPIPIETGTMGPHELFRCSDPIMGRVDSDRHEFICRRFPAQATGVMDAKALRKLNVQGGPYKSWRLPIRVRVVNRVCWFAMGDADATLDLLSDALFLGRKSAIGCGRVARWDVEGFDADWSWWRPVGDSLRLMKTLPAGDWLPPRLVKARRSFGSFKPPYWHRGACAEVVVPC